MIHESFDPLSPPVFCAADIHKRPDKPLCDALLITFSKNVIDHAVARFACRQVADIGGLNGEKPVYVTQYKGKTIGFVMSPITAPVAGMLLEEAAVLTGATRFVLFGSCGALDRQLTQGKLIVPTECYRDEGMSYHYAPAQDYIRVRNAGRVAQVLEALAVPYVMGRAWTTDAIFRETRSRVALRRAEGCIAVDMECAGLQAVCDWYGYEYFTFFYAGDLLDAPAWEQRILGNDGEKDHQLANFLVAMEIAAEVS